MPTPAQFLALFQDLVFLTNSYVSIHLARIDERSGNKRDFGRRINRNRN